MKNPFRTEAAAFHFLWGTIGYFGLIAIASLINTWAGVVVFLLETGDPRRLVAHDARRRRRPREAGRRRRTRRARSGCS